MEDNTLVNVTILIVIIFSTVTFILETEYKDPDLDPLWFGCARRRMALCPAPGTGHALQPLLASRGIWLAAACRSPSPGRLHTAMSPAALSMAP